MSSIEMVLSHKQSKHQGRRPSIEEASEDEENVDAGDHLAKVQVKLPANQKKSPETKQDRGSSKRQRSQSVAGLRP